MDAGSIEKNSRYENLNKEIKIAMRNSAKDMVRLGYMLRQMLEEKLYLVWYDCYEEYLSEELHIDYTAATRFIKCNKKYSVGGNSMDLAPEYAEYSRSLLVEMLNMPPELEARVTPDMTVKQAREVKRQEKQQKGEPVAQAVPREETITDAEFREIPAEPEKVATSQLHDKDWFIRQYVNDEPLEAAELFEICRKEKNNSDRAKAIQKHQAPCHATHCAAYSYEFHGFAGGIDFRVGDEELHLTYNALAAGLMKILEEQEKNKESVPVEMKSAYGLTKTVYPADSLITMEGCGHKYHCSSCAQDCKIRQKDRYCVLAPLGKPFFCTVTMGLLGFLKTDKGNKCQFINHDLAEHTAGSNEADPCCRNCGEKLCMYRCQRSAGMDAKEEAEETAEPEETEEVQDLKECPGTQTELQKVKDILREEKKLLQDYLEVGELPERTVERQKIIVGALASMVYDLENTPDPEPQPDLPVFRNNDQRKAWLNAYKEWGLWYRDGNLDVNYYKYDFDDGSRLVVAEYPQRQSYYTPEHRDEHYYHLFEKNIRSYAEKFREQTDSETYLVEFLKNLQKKK